MSVAELHVLDRTGDMRIIWDSERADEVANARATFEDFTKNKKYSAFAVAGDGSKGKLIREFDPQAEKIILAPQMVGG